MGIKSALLHSAVLGGQAVVAGGYNAASTAIFNAYALAPSTPRKDLIDAVVVALKAGQNVWSKLDALYVFACAEAQGSLVNWINPGTYNATTSGGPAFATDAGYTGNPGTSAYINSNFNPTSAGSPKFTQNSGTLIGWSNTIGAANNGSLVGAVGANGLNNVHPRYATATAFFRVNNASGVSVANSDGTGLYAADRSSSVALAGYINGSSVVSSGASNSSAPDNGNLLFLSYDSTQIFNSGIILAGGFGQSLGSTGQSELYAALHTYMQAVAGVA